MGSQSFSADAELRQLGSRLAELRLALNLTQAELAEQAGVSKRTIERLESGATASQLSTFLRVCRVLGLQDRLKQLLPAPVASPVAQLKQQRQTRKRASSPTESSVPDEEAPKHWIWEP
jgi:transcriptional regulator with XRE-family HTH domain